MFWFLISIFLCSTISSSESSEHYRCGNNLKMAIVLTAFVGGYLVGNFEGVGYFNNFGPLGSATSSIAAIWIMCLARMEIAKVRRIIYDQARLAGQPTSIGTSEETVIGRPFDPNANSLSSVSEVITPCIDSGV